MRGYVSIQNYSHPGFIAISRASIISIVSKTVSSFKGTSLNKAKSKKGFSLYRPVEVNLTKEGKASVIVSVEVAQGNKVSELCLALQKEIASNLSMMIDSVPYEIKIKVAKVS